MAGCGEWGWVPENLQPYGKVLSNAEHGARTQAGPHPKAADLCRRRIGSGEESHRTEVRRLRDARRFPGSCRRQDRRHERTARKIGLGPHAIWRRRLRLYAKLRARGGARARAHYRRQTKRQGICELSAVAARNAARTEHVDSGVFRIKPRTALRVGGHPVASAGTDRQIRGGWRRSTAVAIQSATRRDGDIQRQRHAQWRLTSSGRWRYASGPSATWCC